MSERRATGPHTLLSILLAAVALALGWFSEHYAFSRDITINQRHSLTPQTVAAIGALSAPVEILAIVGPNPQQRDAVTALITRYQQIKKDIELTFINPETDPARARELDAAPGGELILRTAGRERRLQSLSERSLTGALRHLAREGERHLAYITGHDERSPSLDTNSGWGLVSQRLAASGLTTRELSLVSEPHISDDIDVLVIAAPRRPYFPGEIASVQNYLNRGGNLLWLVETPLQADSGPGLESIALQLGIDSLPGVVIDTASQSLQSGSPTFVVLDQFPSHPITATLSNAVVFPEARAFTVIPLAGQTTQPLLQTPASSWTEIGALEGEVIYDSDSNEQAGPLILGIAIERIIAGQQQRIVIVGDADFGSSQFVGNGANLALAESLFIWLAGNSEELAFVTQAANDATLNLSVAAIITLSSLFLAAIPLTLLLFGLYLGWQRRQRN